MVFPTFRPDGAEDGGHLFLEYLGRACTAPENSAPVHKLPARAAFYSAGLEVGKVLILAREEIVAALLGLMVELQSLEPLYLAEGEEASQAILRERPEVVVIDCDHQDCTETLLDVVKQSGARAILFSPFRMQAEVSKLASRHGVGSFTLPTDPETFGRILEAEATP